MGYSPWGREESDTTERLHFHFSLSCIGEGNGTPLQCSCLENPRDGGAWWAAVYGVAQSRTRLKRLSSSSSMGPGRPAALTKRPRVCDGPDTPRASFLLRPAAQALRVRMVSTCLGAVGHSAPRRHSGAQADGGPISFTLGPDREPLEEKRGWRTVPTLNPRGHATPASSPAVRTQRPVAQGTLVQQ